MLDVILNWAKPMIACAAHKKLSLHVVLQEQAGVADYTNLLRHSFGYSDVLPYTLHPEASCQLCLYGSTGLNFPYGCSGAVTLYYICVIGSWEATETLSQ